MNKSTTIGITALTRKQLFRTGGIAALVALVLIPVQIVVFGVWPPPGTVSDWFSLLQANPIRGLLNFDLLYMVTNTLMVPIYLALYTALKETDEAAMTLAILIGLVGVTIYFASNPAVEMLSLSHLYAAATTPERQAALLAAGEAMLATYKGTAFVVYYLLNAATLLILSIVMLHSHLFSKLTAWAGIISGIFMIVPSTFGTVGLIFSLLSLLPWALFSILIARRLLSDRLLV